MTRIPNLTEFVYLALAAYRLTRLAGWDEFPLAARARAWVTGEEWRSVAEAAPEHPGKTPESQLEDVEPTYRRPTLAHLIHCPFCMGWWVSLTVYVAWLAAPRPTLYAMLPFAISAVVGLIAKNLDA